MDWNKREKDVLLVFGNILYNKKWLFEKLTYQVIV